MITLPPPPPLNLHTIDPFTLHTLITTQTSRGQKTKMCTQKFLKVLILGHDTPYGPEFTLASDWKSHKNKLALYSPGPQRSYIHMEVDFYAHWPRKELVPLPAKTTWKKVEHVREKVQKNLPHETPKTVTACVIMLLTGHSPNLTTKKDGTIQTC